MSPPPTTAWSISVRETLDLLDGACEPQGNGVNRGEYALWLGSGISRERVVGLNGVLRKLIEFLRSRIDRAEANCPFKKALDDVLVHATLSTAERTRIDYINDSANWPDIEIILVRLADKYSRVLDVTVTGQASADYLLWDAIDFIHTFENQEPDAEHLCVGILVLEGLISEIVSANWDGLLEAAMLELQGTLDVFRICVTGADFRGPAIAARLLKFHGCALRAIQNEAEYRPLLIARWSQIVGWMQNQNFEAMKQELASVSSRSRTLMIGMSAQDPNIQQLFQLALTRAVWAWDDNPPAHVFAENEIGESQRTILQISYADNFHQHHEQIIARSRIQAYGKPLLVALVINALYFKYCSMVKSVDVHLQLADRVRLCEGLREVRNLMANAAEPNRLAFVRGVIRHIAHIRSMLQEGRVPTDARPPYRSISNHPSHLDVNNPNLRSTGQGEAAVGAGLLGLGCQSGKWTLEVDEPIVLGSGAARVTSHATTARVIFVAHDGIALQLFNSGVYREEDEDVILVHSSPVVAPRQRSPSTRLGRNGRPGVRHVDMRRLLESGATSAELEDQFQKEASI